MVNYIIKKLRLRALCFGIQNLWRWFPIIWQDRQWDHSYVFWILQLKLSLMEKYFDSDKAVCADAKLRAKQIRTCRILVDRILLDDYTTMFDNRDAPGFQRFSEAFEKSMANKSTDILILSREDTPLENKIFNWKIEAEDRIAKQDVDLLFKLIAKRISGWWD